MTVLICQAAGLPNIKGNLGSVQMTDNTTQDGALKFIKTRGYNWTNSYSSVWYSGQQKLDASESNPIYGKSDTVQPANATVRLWKRIS